MVPLTSKRPTILSTGPDRGKSFVTLLKKPLCSLFGAHLTAFSRVKNNFHRRTALEKNQVAYQWASLWRKTGQMIFRFLFGGTHRRVSPDSVDVITYLQINMCIYL
ncbi:MAG: hypothetical protein ACLQPD_25830 [Desulfomonilaceae bacterium]